MHLVGDDTVAGEERFVLGEEYFVLDEDCAPKVGEYFHHDRECAILGEERGGQKRILFFFTGTLTLNIGGFERKI